MSSRPSPTLKAWLSAVIAVLGLPAFASDLPDNPENNRLYRSAHYLGRGDTGIADTDDQEAIYYNPAGLAQGKGIYKRFVIASPHIEVSSATRDVYNSLYVDKEDQTEVLKDQIGQPFHVGATSMTALVFRRAAVSALLSNNANVLVRKDPEFGGLETVEADLVSNQAATFSLAEQYFNERLLIGGTAKYINRGQAGFQTNIIDAENIRKLDDDDVMRMGRGTGFDLGLMLKSGPSVRLTEQSFGLTITDVGGTKFDAEEDKPSPNALKQAVNIGYALSIGTKYSRLKLLADYRDVTGAYEKNRIKRTHFGSEINVLEFIGITAGLNQGYPTGGLYIDSRIVRLDLGFYTEERGDRVGEYPDQRYFLRLLVGL